MIVSVKYGFISEEHWYVYKNITLCPELLSFDLVATVVNNNSIKNLAQRV